MEGLEITVLLGLTILLGFVPALRDVQLPPETVLLLFLPVMLFWESLTTSLRSIRRDFRYILPMSTLLVVAFAFAALGRLLPRRAFMKLKAESLTNDGTALVLYAIAVSLAVGGNITPFSVTWMVIVSYVGGIAAGVLAVVVAGLIAAYLGPRITTAASRRQAEDRAPNLSADDRVAGPRDGRRMGDAAGGALRVPAALGAFPRVRRSWRTSPRATYARAGCQHGRRHAAAPYRSRLRSLYR